MAKLEDIKAAFERHNGNLWDVATATERRLFCEGYTEGSIESNVLARVQHEVSEWAGSQFGNNLSKRPGWEGIKLYSTPPLLGMVEELGELAAVDGKSHQGRFKGPSGQLGTPEEAYAHRRDALADLLIFMCDYARREGISLSEALDETWEFVKERRQKTWLEDKAKEAPLGVTMVKIQDGLTKEFKQAADLEAEVGLGQTGQGWAEPLDYAYEQYRIEMAKAVPLNRKPLDSSYNRYCKECNRTPVHHTNSLQICPDCYPKYVRDQAGKIH